MDVGNVLDLVGPSTALTLDLTLDSPAFTHQGTRRLQQGVKSSVLVANVKDTTIETLEEPLGLGLIGNAVD